MCDVPQCIGRPEQLRALWNRGIGEGGQFSRRYGPRSQHPGQRIQQQRLHQVEQIAKADRNRAKAYGLDPERVITIEPFKFERAKPEQFPDYAKHSPVRRPLRPSTLEAAGSQAIVDQLDPVSGGALKYEPTTAAGRAVALPAEMAGGAVVGGMGGGARGAIGAGVRQGVIPGAAVTGAQALGVQNPVALGASASRPPGLQKQPAHARPQRPCSGGRRG